MLSPGTYCQKYAKKANRKISKLREKERTKEYKKKRRHRKENRNAKTKQLEVREGPQYRSGLGYRNHVLEEILPPVQFPEVRQVSTKDFKRVVFDLETSSRGSVDWLWTVYSHSTNLPLSKIAKCLAINKDFSVYFLCIFGTTNYPVSCQIIEIIQPVSEIIHYPARYSIWCTPNERVFFTSWVLWYLTCFQLTLQPFSFQKPYRRKSLIRWQHLGYSCSIFSWCIKEKEAMVSRMCSWKSLRESAESLLTRG